MPPPAGGSKRKRPDRGYSEDQSSNRPSPHRPQNLHLAQSGYQSNDRDFNQHRGRGGRRSSRGGRGAYNASSPVNSPNQNSSLASQVPTATPESSTIKNDPSTVQESVEHMAALSGPPAEMQPYSYTYVTDAACESWQTVGKEDVLRYGLEGMQDEEGAQLTSLMQELVNAVVFARLEPVDAGELVKQMLESEMLDEQEQHTSLPTPLQAALLDSVSIMFESNPGFPTDRLAAFIVASGIPHELLRHELDAALLEQLSMIRNTFNRMGIRKQTNLLYRQANFNLMREESEGFAKLITELFTTSSTEVPTGDAVKETVEKVKAMIGAFDLDVGRSLDVVLDVFSAVLVKQCRFFVKFLRASPWWPRASLLGKRTSSLTGLPLWALPGSSDWLLTEEQRRTVADKTRLRDEAFWSDARDRGLTAFYSLDGMRTSMEQRPSASNDEPSSQWIKETGTLPPPGNRDAAQLLGFKLRFYSSSPARDETDVLPDNLIYLSALLIKIGFVSLVDLYPHIWRTDDAMAELKEQKIKEKQERERAARPGAGVKNALATAGALADDTLPATSRLKESATRASTPSRDPEMEKPATKDNVPADQKVLLLKSLLAVGALPEALFILGRFPWLMDLIPELPDYIHRILHYALCKTYGEVQPMQDRQSLRDQKPSYETDIPGLPKGHVKVIEPTERKVLKWAQLDKNDSADGTDYRFYWDEWNDNIPVCQTVEDVFTLCNTLLPLVGVKIGHDVGLLLKLARIGKQSLYMDRSESNRNRWLELIKRVLLPALSLTKSNSGVVNEVFELVSIFPVSVRYLLYLEWSTGRTSRNPDVKSAFDQARAETKDILKRISNTNVRPMARALAKIAFANPHIVITTALTQIEVYDSIAEVFVEGARYFTDLGYDVLSWAIVSSMAKTGRNRTQDGGIFASRWLSALSVFAGKIYKRYGMMKPAPILQYVAEQLDHGNTMDLKMLEQIVLSMAGISTDTSYNDAQLQAMGGGPLLQGQIILQLLDRRHDSKKTSERLVKSLQDAGLAGKFLISMAQQRQSVVFEDGEVPLKAIGNTYDEVQRVMVQYLDLLRTNMSPDEFRAAVPDVVSLLVDYEIPPEIAFWIARPLISRQMRDFDQEHRKEQQVEEVKDINGDIDMSEQINGSLEEDGETGEIDTVLHDSPPAGDILTPILEVENGNKATGVSDTPSEDYWHPVMKDLMATIQPSLSDEVDEIIGPAFYTTFWQLSLYDIAVPSKSYEDESSRQRRKIAAITADRSDVSVSGTRKKELATKEIQELIDNLLLENKQHLKAFLDGKARLQREKEHWFIGKTRMDKALNTALIEHCFLPRMLSSPLDAYFCFKFLKVLHTGGTPNFRTLGFYDLFFRTSRLISLIFMCTSKEADNLGKFLNEVLKDLARWHASKTVYEKEGCGPKRSLPGFALKIEAGRVVSLLDFENFQKILYKWHNNLFAALQKCLTSPEYMHVRNAISVLRTISTTYPAVNYHGTGLQKAVDKLRDSDKEDLNVSSQALLGALHRREKSWVETTKFRKGPEKKSELEQEQSQSDTVVAQDVTRNIGEAGKQENSTNVKDEAMSNVPLKPLMSTITPESAESPGPTRPSRLQPTAEPFRPSSRNTSRPATTNGATTPSRGSMEAAISSTRESRPPRPDSSKPHNLPRRLPTPPPSRSNHAGLPTRPDAADARNGHRDSPRMPSRGDVEPSRLPHDARTSHGRDARSAYRATERPDHHLEDYDRHSRRYERPEGPPFPVRDEGVYGREYDRRDPYERLPGPERDRPTQRPPLQERERDSREPGPRSRPPPTSEPPKFDSQIPQRRDTPAAPTINPARASLIDGGGEQRPAPDRNHTQEKPSRLSRPSSPRREDERKPQPQRDFDDRSRQELSSVRHTAGQSHMEAAPSTIRNVGSGQHRREPRDPRPPSTIDMQHGRLEQESTRAPPPQPSDRPQEADVPSGPRGRPSPGGGPRMRAPPLNTQIPSTPAVERPTPTGPARRQHGRTSSYTDASSTPGTPAGESAGVHPSRLGQIDAGAPDPSRSNQISQSPQPPPQAPPQAQPPAGPRGGNAPLGAPSGPSPTSRGPPSGPHSAESSMRGGRSNRNPIAGINNTLAQAGTTIRGRGGSRQGSTNFGPHMPPPPPPPSGGPPPTNHSPSANGYGSNDLFGSSNPNDVPVGTRPLSSRPDGPRMDRRTDGNESHSTERRSTRPSRHDEARGDREQRGERDNREAKEERFSGGDSSRRDERPARRENQPPGGDERRGYPRSGPREEPSSRKHGRGEDELPPYGRGPGQGGSSGRGDKRIRRGH